MRGATMPMQVSARTGELTGHFIDRYQVIEMLGQGGMSEVYLAIDHRLDRLVALKTAGGPHGGALLAAEAAALAQLSDPHVVAVYDLVRAGAASYLVLELVDGEPLDRWLERAPAWRRVVDAFAQAAHGLAAAHARGIVHRDVKPANLLRGHDGRVRVADFGVALVPGVPRLDALRVGTVRYMAPEQLAGHADQRTDQFGLGVALFEALNGFHPYGSPAVLDGTVRPVVTASAAPTWVGDAVLRAIAIEPERRWPTMAALADALSAAAAARSRIVGHDPSHVARSVPPRVLRPAQRVRRTAHQVPREITQFGDRVARRSPARWLRMHHL